MKFNTSDRILLTDIYKSPKGIYLYNFHKRYSVYPSQLINFISKYKSLGLISTDGNKILITKKGISVIQKDKEFRAKRNKRNIFGTIPKEFIQPKLEINAFYLANLDFLLE